MSLIRLIDLGYISKCLDVLELLVGKLHPPAFRSLQDKLLISCSCDEHSYGSEWYLRALGVIYIISVLSIRVYADP